MNKTRFILALVLAAGVGACGHHGDAGTESQSVDEPQQEQAITQDNAEAEPFEVVPGLMARTLKEGGGRAAEAGDVVNVHYTGWLQDPAAEDGRGRKFDSSIDRGQQFSFPLGAGRVIKGWDQGVAGMLIGEKRELTIAPDLAYGERGYPGAIPPNSTLIFEVELFSAEPLSSAPAE